MLVPSYTFFYVKFSVSNVSVTGKVWFWETVFDLQNTILTEVNVLRCPCNLLLDFLETTS